MNLLQTTLVLAGVLIQPAQGANTAAGTLRINGTSIKLTHARAHLHDNAEGLISRKSELRILLTDREVPATALYGVSFPPVWQMAMRGEVQGLLLEMDPADPNNINAIVLQKPREAGRSLMNLGASVTGGKLFKEWKLAGGRVSGSIDRGKDEPSENEDIPNIAYTVRFDAKVDAEPPVTQDLKGAQALASAPVRALLLAADAMSRADFPALKKLSTASGAARLDELIATAGGQAKTIARQNGTEMKALLKKVKRVVIRGDRATVIMPDGNSAAVVREAGAWKTDN